VSRPATTVRSVTAVALGALILGATAAALREIDVGSTAAGFWRVALALPVLMAFTAVNARNSREGLSWPQASQWRTLTIAGGCFAGDLVFWHLALTHTSLGNATFLATLCSLWVPITVFALYRVAPSRRFLLGLIGALAGAGILVSAHLSFDASTWVGDGYGLITGFFFTGYILAIRRCRETLSTTDTMLYSSTLCAAFLLPLALAANIVAGEAVIPSSATGWASVVALGLLAHLLGQGLVAYGTGSLSASLAAVILCLEGVGAMVVGALFYAESRSWLDALAVLLIVGGIALSQSKSNP